MKGRIRRRSKSSWELTIDIGRDAQGKRQRKFVAVQGKKADAERKLRELLASLDKGAPIDTGRITVAEYLHRWHADYVVPHTRPRTAERYAGDIRNHLIPHLGHHHLTKLAPPEIQAMEAAMAAKGLSPSSVQHAHRVLSEALKHAGEWGLLWNNPCNFVRPPRQIRKEIRVPDASTMLRLLAISKETAHSAAFHFLAYTGARRGEVCGLMWADIDLDAALARIQRGAVRVKGEGIVMLPPKTERGRRTVALDPDTVDVLRAHRGEQLMWKMELGDRLYQDRGFVFPSPTGEPLDPLVLTDAWRRLATKAGVQGVRLHDLRHFHASVLLQANTNPKIVQERLGHATISVTLATNSHSIPSLQKQATQDFADIMRSAGPSA